MSSDDSDDDILFDVILYQKATSDTKKKKCDEESKPSDDQKKYQSSLDTRQNRSCNTSSTQLLDRKRRCDNVQEVPSKILDHQKYFQKDPSTLSDTHILSNKTSLSSLSNKTSLSPNQYQPFWCDDTQRFVTDSD